VPYRDSIVCTMVDHIISAVCQCVVVILGNGLQSVSVLLQCWVVGYSVSVCSCSVGQCVAVYQLVVAVRRVRSHHF